MKQFFFLLLITMITSGLTAQGVTKHGEQSATSANFVDKNGKLSSIVALDKNGKLVVSVVNGLTINHIAGTVAPVTKTVTYGTVVTSLSGASKTWITQNLGASNQATSITDATEPSHGWYFQFNRKQGYKHDGTTITPVATTMVASINESSDWIAANDPCTIELGTGWRIPTNTEWSAVATNWSNSTNAFNSVLKLQSAGNFVNSNGSFGNQGTFGTYWTSTQESNVRGMYMGVAPSTSVTGPSNKYYGLPVRCIKDEVAVGAFGLTINHIAGTVAPVTKTVPYGTVTTNLSGSSKTWITQNLGASNQAASASDLTEPTTGWFFQFNRKQGYKHDGTTRTPNSAWINSISESSDWVLSNDPCAIELGTGWRIPTTTEWVAVTTNGGWSNNTAAYNSVLKIGALPFLDVAGNWQLGAAGSGFLWSTTASSLTKASYFASRAATVAMESDFKYFAYAVRCLKDDASSSGLIINHTAGTVAPVTKTVSYGTVETALSGTNKKWITQNLGASTQATSVTDANEPSAGWYFQFNRKQGYKNDGTTRTPNTTWTTSISEDAGWSPANDPCTIELGTGWRLPISSEWVAVNANGAWTNYNSAYSSVLKMHASGYLQPGDGARVAGGCVCAWSSTQSSNTNGSYIGVLSNSSTMWAETKAYAFPVRCIKDEPSAPLTITHTAGVVAPVTKTVNYGTVITSLSGASKTWITQNLGSSNQATSATDATEASAGWYFQFNRKQGYQHDGTTRTPNSAWITSINENTDWVVANDPCTIELGAGWRIPTGAELTAVDVNGGWNNYTDAYNSVLKLHTAGALANTDGSLLLRGVNGYAYLWSSTQYVTNAANQLGATTASSVIGVGSSKVYGFSIRCLKDDPSTTLTVTHTAGTVAPVTKTVSYGLVTTNLSGASKTWITQNLGASNQPTSVTDATESSAGWYFQFNRKQGYKNDGSTRTPGTTWVTSISEDANWSAGNDPCTIELGNGWRIPTNSEWTAVNTNGAWTTYNSAFNSALRMHASGYLQSTDGVRVQGCACEWSSTQSSTANGNYIGVLSNSSAMYAGTKAYAFPLRCIKDSVAAPTPVIGLTINHIAGTVAPVNKTITYGTVVTNLSGTSKTWITQNLGSTTQATSALDATEAAHGWYFQFNRKQGYKHDGTTRTPNSAWVTNISESTDWIAANDPCTIELGTGWRIPTSAEWTAVDANGNWSSYTDAYSSVLKLHSPGNYLNIDAGGTLANQGIYGSPWTSTQSSASQGLYMGVSTGVSGVGATHKGYGLPLRCIKDSVAPVIGLTVNHTAGTVAPVTKTVTYGTVVTNLSGANKTWITRNLGASSQATSTIDATEASAGWYFQFNRKQGYQHDGTTRTPNSAWIGSISESADWEVANDPCTIELGSGWRLPTNAEWTAVNTSGGWTTNTNAYNSVLKIHAGGYLTNGALTSIGSVGYYWSSGSYGSASGRNLVITSGGGTISNDAKTNAFSVRCLNDDASLFIINHTAGLVAPVTKTVQYKTVTTSLSGTSKLWLAQNLGSTNQATSATDATEASAGWYFQFNRKQGYKHDGTTRTPATTWISSTSENSDWVSANDPCVIELGSGWRVPTWTEWTVANTNGAWSNYNNTYSSVLKLAVTGYLAAGNGNIVSRSTDGYYWSSTTSGLTSGYVFYTVSGSSGANSTDNKAQAFPVRCIKDDIATTLTINHTAGTVAPVSKTVSYGLVTSTLSGSSKTWISQNLGASNQATSATDATEPSAGWYFQFNRKQGFKHDGTTRTPATAWITSINESSDWVAANDPCTIELGAGWRIPTDAEWAAVGTNGAWSNYNSAYSSVLKMHTSGYVGGGSAGSLGGRGATGYFWSATQSTATNGFVMSYSSSAAVGSAAVDKYGGYTLRCLKDVVVGPLTINHTAGTVAPVNKTITYGTVTTNLSGATKMWITQNLGSTNQATSATDATEEAAGWFFQFNRKQGYKHDGTTRTPATAWNTSISESSDWAAANDPCTLELGAGWRIPTTTEWTAVDANGSWNTYTDAYNSVLKIHSAGSLQTANGAKGTGSGNYWSSTQSAASTAAFLGMTGSASSAGYVDSKAWGFSIRCIKD